MANTDSTKRRIDDKTAAFQLYGIDDGSDLIPAMLDRLQTKGIDGIGAYTNNSDRFTRSLKHAFKKAFIAKATPPLVPEAVTVALDEAVEQTTKKFPQIGENGVAKSDLRTQVLPYFYGRLVNEYHIAVKLGADRHTGVGVQIYY